MSQLQTLLAYLLNSNINKHIINLEFFLKHKVHVHPTPETLMFEIDIFLGNCDLALIELPNILGGDTMMAKLLEPDSAVSCRVNFGLSGI